MVIPAPSRPTERLWLRSGVLIAALKESYRAESLLPGGPDGPQLFSSVLIRKRFPPLSCSELNTYQKS